MLLNCDLGESYGSWTMGLDEEVMPHIDQANVACGFHGGDPLTMRKTLRLAAEHGVELTLLHGNAEAVPCPDQSFDFAISSSPSAICVSTCSGACRLPLRTICSTSSSVSGRPSR